MNVVYDRERPLAHDQQLQAFRDQVRDDNQNDYIEPELPMLPPPKERPRENEDVRHADYRERDHDRVEGQV